MSPDYDAAWSAEAEQITRTLRDLDAVLADSKVAEKARDATQLRVTVRKMLVTVNTNVEALAGINRQDIFGQDPTLSTQRYRLIENLQSVKIDFEFSVLPAVERLTRDVISDTRALAAAAAAPESGTNPAPSEPSEQKGWTERAESFLEQAGKTADVFAKAVTLLRALGSSVGLPLPF